MSELDKNFKRVFSFELLLHRIENTKSENEQYTKILLEKTIAGLTAQGKITIDYNSTNDDYLILPVNGSESNRVIAKKLTNARKTYKQLAEKMGSARSDVTGRSWTDGKVLEMCHLVDAVIYPITISEGLLDMSETLTDFASQFNAAKPEPEEE
jgi:uncharacterized protein YeeX (DUF496 family)